MTAGADSTGRRDERAVGVHFASRRGVLDDGVGLIRLEGEVDLATAPAFKADVESLLADGFVNVVVDLTQVTFIDSTALGVLIGSVRRLREKDGRLVLIANGFAVTRPLTLTGLDRVFTIVETREQAAEQF